jgi:peptidoglycan/LPS O-acetylase OafA/YrhL
MSAVPRIKRTPADAAKPLPAKGKTNLEGRRMPHIDSLRAIAALSVLLIHTGWFSGLNYARGAGQFNQRLDVGVAVFFVISGVLLYRPFALAHLNGTSAPTTGPYAWRRFLRIVPAYWLALTVTVLLVGTRKFAPPVFTLGGIPRYYLFAQDYSRWSIAGGLGQAWTLSIEVAFYAFLPLYAWLQRQSDAGPNRALRTEIAGLLLLVAISEIWKYYVLAGGNHSRVAVTPGLVSLPAYLDQFALGMGLALLSAWIEVRGRNPRWVATYDRFPAIAWLLALFAFWLVSAEVLPGQAGASWDIVQYLGRQWLYGVIGLCLLFPAIVGDQSRGVVRRLLGIRVLAWLGLISYGIYLWHVTIMEELQNLGFNPEGDLKAYIEWPVVTLVLTVVVAAASFYLLERPALSLKRMFDRKVSRPRPEPAAVGTLAQR